MVQVQDLDVPPERPLVGGDLPAGVEGLHPPGG